MRRAAIIACLGNLAWLVLGQPARAEVEAARLCPPMPAAKTAFSVQQSAPLFHQDLERAEVARMAGAVLSGHTQQGLTRAEAEFGFDMTLNVLQLAPRRYCAALGRIDARWRLSRLDVYIVREHRPGTCPHAVIRAHEEQHVAIAQRLFLRHAGQVRARLTQWLSEGGRVVAAASPAQARQMLQDSLDEAMKPALEAFAQDLARANAAIDTPESYRAETAKCPRWN